VPSRPPNLQKQEALSGFYRRNPAVIVCQDDPSELEAVADELRRFDAALVVERSPGPLSEVLGRPSVTVIDRYFDIRLQATEPPAKTVLTAVERSELRCEECPQAADELRSPWAEVAKELASQG
jgi:hypothetical protein